MTTTTNLTTFLPPVPAGSLLFQRAATNPVKASVASATNLGWLAAGKSQLEVVSQLTSQVPLDIYSFTLQTGEALNAKVTNIANPDGSPSTAVHVQLYDGSGSHVLADNQGTAAQKKAYAEFTSSTGLSAKPGSFVIKVGYGTGANKAKNQNYAIQIDSGTKGFINDYRTLASPSTVNFTLLQGGQIGYSSASITASLLFNVSNGATLNIFDALNANANAATTNVLT